MRALRNISFLILFCACKPQTVSQYYISDLKYSSYTWRTNPDTDEWYFYLFSYLHIDSTGHYVLMSRETFNGELRYFTGTVKRTKRELIDSILTENTYFPDLSTDVFSDTDIPLVIYSGPTYLLDYQIYKAADRTKIGYIDSESRTPRNILFLTSLLESQLDPKQKETDTFHIDSYLDTLKKLSSYILPPPPSLPPPPVDRN